MSKNEVEKLLNKQEDIKEAIRKVDEKKPEYDPPKPAKSRKYNYRKKIGVVVSNEDMSNILQKQQDMIEVLKHESKLKSHDLDISKVMLMSMLGEEPGAIEALNAQKMDELIKSVKSIGGEKKSAEKVEKIDENLKGELDADYGDDFAEVQKGTIDADYDDEYTLKGNIDADYEDEYALRGNIDADYENEYAEKLDTDYQEELKTEPYDDESSSLTTEPYEYTSNIYDLEEIGRVSVKRFINSAANVVEDPKVKEKIYDVLIHKNTKDGNRDLVIKTYNVFVKNGIRNPLKNYSKYSTNRIASYVVHGRVYSDEDAPMKIKMRTKTAKGINAYESEEEELRDEINSYSYMNGNDTSDEKTLKLVSKMLKKKNKTRYDKQLIKNKLRDLREREIIDEDLYEECLEML